MFNGVLVVAAVARVVVAFVAIDRRDGIGSVFVMIVGRVTHGFAWDVRPYTGPG